MDHVSGLKHNGHHKGDHLSHTTPHSYLFLLSTFFLVPSLLSLTPPNDNGKERHDLRGGE